MILFCEECGSKNKIDDEEIKGGHRCAFCNAYLSLDRTVEKFKRRRLTENATLKLRFQNEVIELSSTRPILTIGRKSTNDLTLNDSKASRFHARIELRDNEFLLIDHSKNGTFLFIKGDQPTSLRQDSIALNGSGIIGLGRKIDPEKDKIIHFEIV